ncbi:MAG: hypothetical protein JWP97_386 [Labilithrix sp.]|nr:hypothetical protein [Labilithrix sp.]
MKHAPVATALVTAGALALALLTPGCYATSTAYDGKLTFAYAAGADFVNFVKPIAPGAKLDVVAFANGTETKLVVIRASSSKPSVLTTALKDDTTVVLTGGVPGVAEITLTARDEQGRELTDRMFFHVQKPETHRLEHACTSEPRAIYVRGATVDVYHALQTADARPVVGYGYAPVTIEPPADVELVAQPQAGGFYRYRLPSRDARISLTSKVDASRIDVDVVDRATLTEAHLVRADDTRVFEGGSTYAVAQVTGPGNVTVCSQDALTRARSLTPDICTATARLDDAPDDENHEQIAEITGLAFGTCRYEITLPELDGGKGVRLEGKVRVGRYEFPPARGAGLITGPVWRMRAWLLGTSGWIVALLVVLPNALFAAFLGWRRRRAGR